MGKKGQRRKAKRQRQKLAREANEQRILLGRSHLEPLQKVQHLDFLHRLEHPYKRITGRHINKSMETKVLQAELEHRQ